MSIHGIERQRGRETGSDSDDCSDEQASDSDMAERRDRYKVDILLASTSQALDILHHLRAQQGDD